MAVRLLNDPPQAGAVNMARDEALMTLVGQGASAPTLRLYEWSEPTVSIGYFQHVGDHDALGPPVGEMPVVRRLTGGGAILHDRELTYSLTLPTRHPAAVGRAARLYEIVHDALIDVLKEMNVRADRGGASDGSGAAKGPFFCFARRHRFDVLIGAEKVAGSAQRRTRCGILQHGSIIIEGRFDQQPVASLGPRGVDASTLRERLPAALGRRMEATITTGSWNDDELQLAHSLQAKYAGDAWNRRR